MALYQFCGFSPHTIIQKMFKTHSKIIFFYAYDCISLYLGTVQNDSTNSYAMFHVIYGKTILNNHDIFCD